MARQLGTEKFVGSEMGWRVGEEEQLNHASLVALRASPHCFFQHIYRIIHSLKLCYTKSLFAGDLSPDYST
ncbi:hypothetical protein CEXT_759701 [Caerostris extrusa]|uniref:Uncharacterized protein n=1 Tax=Caerostris extrusa TaxID=172846 RepID=A0AAV4N2F0_CAEEX|nr:hypothetical protein CEXT_759701 [Caerostris extrusa]